MKPQSKSKTFPKGTDFQELADFFTKEIHTTNFDMGDLDREGDCSTLEKYLITIIRYPEKEEGQ